MIAGNGIDIIEIGRFRKSKKKWGRNFLDKIFTPGEIEYSKKRRFQDQHLAARFAANADSAAVRSTPSGSATGHTQVP